MVNVGDKLVVKTGQYGRKPRPELHITHCPQTYTGVVTEVVPEGKYGPSPSGQMFWFLVEQVDGDPKKPGEYPSSFPLHENEILQHLPKETK